MGKPTKNEVKRAVKKWLEAHLAASFQLHGEQCGLIVDLQARNQALVEDLADLRRQMPALARQVADDVLLMRNYHEDRGEFVESLLLRAGPQGLSYAQMIALAAELGFRLTNKSIGACARRGWCFKTRDATGKTRLHHHSFRKNRNEK